MYKARSERDRTSTGADDGILQRREGALPDIHIVAAWATHGQSGSAVGKGVGTKKDASACSRIAEWRPLTSIWESLGMREAFAM